GVRQLAQPVGQTTNTVSGLPAGRAKRVNPPLTAIFKEKLVRKYELFFRILSVCTAVNGIKIEFFFRLAF
ncbi:hypothetical protein, partial [Escherichia coli]|uniref:hypothetical protein n=1 Tax=Escherichia coli TaxID=562 RepID=UPI0021B1E979